ncbi:regulatory protein [Sinosporangium album]|uniref:Regulatory protein RecX n=1 Tax=Sinosporangium album TaxID=504805 RepID=A0A1G7S067_9ACTN|nr:recombination regulator RecX [Sinosporangium album]SDG16381.1 regulatory protein [Sinosporangium album]
MDADQPEPTGRLRRSRPVGQGRKGWRRGGSEADPHTDTHDDPGHGTSASDPFEEDARPLRRGTPRKSTWGKATRRAPSEGDQGDLDPGRAHPGAADGRGADDRRASGRGGFGSDEESRKGSRERKAALERDPHARAREICLRLLTLAPKTRAQLADALRKREIPDDVAEAVLSRFSEVGLINDEAFAEAWVNSRHHGRGLARRALAVELRRRGVEDDTVKEAVERLDPDQEVETARRLVARKLAATRGLAPDARMRRVVGMLARKGYSSGLAYRVAREAMEAENIPDETTGEEPYIGEWS